MKALFEEDDIIKENENKNNIPESDQLKITIEEVPEITSIDHIYDEAGYNRIAMKNIFLTFSVLSIEGLHFSFFSYLIIPLKEYYSMTEDQIRIASSLLFIFVGIGSFFSGKLAGKFGRPFLINLLLFIVTLLSIAMAYSNTWYIFTIFRCAIGLLLGFIVPMSLNLLTEYLPLKYRSFVLTSVWAGFGIGALFILFTMLYVMPNMEASKVPNTILISAILPFIVFIINLFLLEDSPRNLIIRNKEKEAFEILERIYQKKLEEKSKAKILHESIQSYQNLTFEIREIFNEKFGRLSLILIYIWFINSILGYGPAITSNLTMKALGKEDNSTNLEITKNQIFVAIINLFSLFLGGVMSESSYFGRKLSTNINQIFAFIFVLLLIMWPSNFPLFYAIFTSLQGIAFNIITTYSCEVYPTKIRDHAIGFLFCSTRIGGFISQILYLYFNVMGLWVPYYATAIFLVINLVLVHLLPYDSYGIALDKEITHKS